MRSPQNSRVAVAVIAALLVAVAADAADARQNRPGAGPAAGPAAGPVVAAPTGDRTRASTDDDDDTIVIYCPKCTEIIVYDTAND